VAVTKPRNKILIFRLTQDEYQALQSASSGARSLSDFARTRLLGSLGEPAIDQQLLELKSTVARIAELLEKDV
jgi:Mobilization protein NikA